MQDPRYAQLAKLLVTHSMRVTPGDRVWVETKNIPDAMVGILVQAICEKGGIPTVEIKVPSVIRKMLNSGTLEELEERVKVLGAMELERMKQMQCFVSLRGSENTAELVDVPADRMALYEKYWQRPVHIEQRVKHTRWVVLRWPNPAVAQLANMSTEAFEDYYFNVCLTDYGAMEKAVEPLVELMKRTDKVRITAPDTDLSFSIKDIGVVPCFGLRNIPDGECYSAPVKNSVNGTVHFNTPTLIRGIAMDDVRFVFENGRVIEATSSNTEALNKILDSDEGARSIGEFALGFNPNVTKPMRDTLFDEKISGSLHLAMGNCYDAAPNGNKSAIHWDIVLRQEGGGEIYFDDVLIRKNGIFVIDELKGLNPDVLGKA